MSEERYSPEEVEAIIRHAMRIEDERSISHEDLVTAAQEIGIAPEAIERAIRDVTQHMQSRSRQQATRQKQQRRLKHEASGMGLIVLMLFMIDLLTRGGWWFQWPALFIVVSLAFRARSLYFPR